MYCELGDSRNICRLGRGCGREIIGNFSKVGGGFHGLCLARLEDGGDLGAHI